MHSDNEINQINMAKDLVINSIGATMDLYGTNRSVGNLYGTMVFEDSMTLDEMRHQLQMSKPSMSSGVKKLQEYGIVKQQFTRGSRKQHFVAEKDFFTFFNNFFSKKWDREIDINMDAVKEAEKILTDVFAHKDTLDAATLAEAERVQAQLDHTKTYYKWLEQISDALHTGKIFDYFPIPENEDTE